MKENKKSRSKPIKHTSTNLEETLRLTRKVRLGKKDAARQWSLLVWSLADDSRPISEDASQLGRLLVLLARSKNFQEGPELQGFVKDSAKQEEVREKNKC